MASCSLCGASFTCGMRETSAPCWCAALPPLQTLDPQQGCLCPGCLARKLAAQDATTASTTAGQSDDR